MSTDVQRSHLPPHPGPPPHGRQTTCMVCKRPAPPGDDVLYHRCGQPYHSQCLVNVAELRAKPPMPGLPHDFPIAGDGFQCPTCFYPVVIEPDDPDIVHYHAGNCMVCGGHLHLETAQYATCGHPMHPECVSEWMPPTGDPDADEARTRRCLKCNRMVSLGPQSLCCVCGRPVHNEDVDPNNYDDIWEPLFRGSDVGGHAVCVAWLRKRRDYVLNTPIGRLDPNVGADVDFRPPQVPTGTCAICGHSVVESEAFLHDCKAVYHVKCARDSMMCVQCEKPIRIAVSVPIGEDAAVAESDEESSDSDSDSGSDDDSDGSSSDSSASSEERTSARQKTTRTWDVSGPRDAGSDDDDDDDDGLPGERAGFVPVKKIIGLAQREVGDAASRGPLHPCEGPLVHCDLAILGHSIPGRTFKSCIPDRPDPIPLSVRNAFPDTMSRLAAIIGAWFGPHSHHVIRARRALGADKFAAFIKTVLGPKCYVIHVHSYSQSKIPIVARVNGVPESIAMMNVSAIEREIGLFERQYAEAEVKLRCAPGPGVLPNPTMFSGWLCDIPGIYISGLYGYTEEDFARSTGGIRSVHDLPGWLERGCPCTNPRLCDRQRFTDFMAMFMPEAYATAENRIRPEWPPTATAAAAAAVAQPVGMPHGSALRAGRAPARRGAAPAPAPMPTTTVLPKIVGVDPDTFAMLFDDGVAPPSAAIVYKRGRFYTTLPIQQAAMILRDRNAGTSRLRPAVSAVEPHPQQRPQQRQRVGQPMARPCAGCSARAETACLVCGKPASQVCSKCNTARYCSVRCQLADWPEHRKDCGSRQAAYRDTSRIGPIPK